MPTRILQVPSFLSLYEKYFASLLDTFFYPSGIFENVLDSLSEMSSIASQQDFWHHLDYSWSYKDYIMNYELPIVKGHQYIDGIESFIQKRQNTA